VPADPRQPFAPPYPLKAAARPRRQAPTAHRLTGVSWSTAATSSTRPYAARVRVLGRRLSVVTGLGQRLPVGWVPEQCRVAAMRDDVIDHGCSSWQRACTALRAHARGMFHEKHARRAQPGIGVTPLTARAA